MIEVTALAAREGDSLWIEWTHGASRHRMLIDGGSGNRSAAPPAIMARLSALPPNERHFDLIVCTHIDADHIDGLLGLLGNTRERVSVGEVWFNGRKHLRGDVLGPSQGEELGDLLGRLNLPWNTAFGDGPIVVPEKGPLPAIRLAGLTLTVLAPGWPALDKLGQRWDAVVSRKDTETGRTGDVLGDRDVGVSLRKLALASYEADLSPANGSSIVLLAEHDDGSRVLLAADAPAEAILPALRRLQPAGRFRVDVCKVPHHGSDRNLSRELVSALDCRHWLFSTNGAKHQHPRRRAVARLLAERADPVLWFNYLCETSKEYAQPDVALEHGFAAVFPAAGTDGITLVLKDSVVTQAGTAVSINRRA